MLISTNLIIPISAHQLDSCAQSIYTINFVRDSQEIFGRTQPIILLY